MSGPVQAVWQSTGMLFKVGVVLLVIMLASNGVLGTFTFIQGLIYSARDRAFDEKEKLADRQIEALIKTSDDLREREAQKDKIIVAKDVELAAKDAIIEGRTGNILERQKEVEKIKDELLNEISRIDAIDDPDALRAELRARLRARGLIK